MSLLEHPVTALNGVGAVRAEAYHKLGICLAGDLLWHFPRSYENRGDVKTLAEATVGEKQALAMTIATKPTVARIMMRGQIMFTAAKEVVPMKFDTK